MSILVTGGAGYIGSHTVVELLQSGRDVVIADDLSNSSAVVVDRIEKITGIRPAFYPINVADKEALSDLFQKENIEAVIHFAAFKAVGESVQKPLMYYRNNLDALLSVLEVMRDFDVKNFIFSSSATVYGMDNLDFPYLESAGTGRPSSPYGGTKVMAEQILQDLSVSAPDWHITILRYFNPVGAHESGLIGEDPTGIPNNLMPYISQVAVGKLEKLSIFGNDYDTVDGTCVRDYIHVVDLAKGHNKALDHVFDHAGVSIYNLGSGTGTSVLQLVQAFIKVTGVDVPYVFGPRRSGDLPAYYSDAHKALVELGWKTEKTIEDMCADSWRWQSLNPKGYEA